jgi:hypothetical protein
MKKLILSGFVLLFFAAFQSNVKADTGDDGYFYSALAPYGQWIELNDGMTAWHPRVTQRPWSPYTYGRWEWTADGWYWDSDEPFGYITYHYGRWYNDEYYGWIWVPDDQWAPAWVEWRYDDDYIGWAPLSPYGVFQVGVGLTFTQEYHTPYNYWNFVHYNNFCDVHVNNYYATPVNRNRIFSNTKYRNDYDYNNGRVVNRGIGYDLVRERSGRPIVQHEIVRVTDPRQLKNNNNNNNKDVIRTYAATRNDITRNNSKNIDIKRPDRKTTLDVSRVTLTGRDQNRVNTNRQTPVTDRNMDTKGTDRKDPMINQRPQEQQRQQVDQQKQQQQRQQVDQQRQQQQRQQVDQQRQQQQRQQVDQQRQQQQRQQVDQQRQQVDQQRQQQQRQQIDQQRQQQQRQQVNQQKQQQQRPQVDQQRQQQQQNRQKPPTEQKRVEQKDNKTNEKDRR